MFSRIFGLYADIPNWGRWLLAAVPFMLVIVAYTIASDAYLAANPNGKLLPSFSQMGEAIWRIATVPERRSGELLLLMDVKASLFRLSVGIALTAVAGLLVGIHMATFPWIRSMLEPFVNMVSNLPVIAVIAIVMIVLGVGDVFKITMIFLGTFFVVTRDVFRSAYALPHQEFTKARTLGASSYGAMWRVMLPQVMPYMLSALRLALPAAWLFLLASEMLASTEGLGYRIFLIRRYMEMRVIIPYVLIISVLALLIDTGLRVTTRIAFPWYQPGKD